tara:strand:- start:34 stop:342 length:309 start_codon:yes stop_codon:yes gene_type:complete
MSEFNLKTGDILLFSYQGNSIFSSFIKYFTGSQITHVGMVLKDPVFIQPSLKGYYVWESGSFWSKKIYTSSCKARDSIQSTIRHLQISYTVRQRLLSTFQGN